MYVRIKIRSIRIIKKIIQIKIITLYNNIFYKFIIITYQKTWNMYIFYGFVYITK